MKRLSGIFGSVAILLVAISLSACTPRGETKTLDEVLQLARDRYEAVANVPVEGQVGQTLKGIVQNLNDLQKPLALPQFAEKSRVTAELLDSLDRKAGYTSRASFADIANQYRALSGQAGSSSAVDSKAQSARTRLLLARTYGLLASELETTKFAVG